MAIVERQSNEAIMTGRAVTDSIAKKHISKRHCSGRVDVERHVRGVATRVQTALRRDTVQQPLAMVRMP